jgi:glycyl-tRNA synthetase beta chain
MSKRSLLLEIGTEEIPAGFMEKALADLKTLAEKEFVAQRLSFAQVLTCGTPRRLALMVEGLAERQDDLEEEVKGPSKKAGIDGDGNYTKAAQGFAKGQGVTVTDLFIKELSGVEYLYALKKETGQDTLIILPQLLPKLITGLSFPKSMRWGEYELRFVRPLRWLLALYGEEVINFAITDIKTDRYTYGHRFLAKGALQVNRPEDYLAVLKEGYVIADQKERSQIIWEQIMALAQGEGGIVKEDQELLAEVTYLVEYSTPLCGSFEEEYLELPTEVLITPMREHQRYFPVYDRQGKLLNKFITVRNGTGDHLDIVRQGNEKVLAARLADARFFYREDLKTPLEGLLPKLAVITYHEEIGTIMAKVKRMEDLTRYVTEAIKLSPEEKAETLRVAKIAKADLVTSMVYEFPELQGIMGAYYARAHGEPETICQGIKEHYLPKFAGDDLPAGIAGWCVSIADKVDTIVGCFGVGIQPTGSQDPYALRRQALAVCHLLLARETVLTVDQLLESAYDRLCQDIKPKISREAALKELKEFFLQRMRNILTDQGHRYDVVEAVLAPGKTNLNNIVKWAEALSDFRQETTFSSLLTGFNRASNLAKKGQGGVVREELLGEAAEARLYQAFLQAKAKVDQLVEQGEYVAALNRLAHLQEPIDQFFAGIMVMVEDEELRANRLALLNSITQYVKDKADLTRIVAD